MTSNVLSGEEYNTRIAATFSSEQHAQECAMQVRAKGLTSEQIKIVPPDDPHPGRKMEPENKGIEKTLVRSHLVLGVGGFIIGLVLWGILYMLNLGLLRAAPVNSLIAFLFFATAGGMMLGGFIGLRPDHQVVVQKVDTAIDEGLWSLVILPHDSDQATLVGDTLSELGVDNVRSL